MTEKDEKLPTVKELEKVVSEVNTLIEEVEVEVKKVVSSVEKVASSNALKVLKTYWVSLFAWCYTPQSTEVPALATSSAPSKTVSK
jgi:division protein CdvB (Snf7/Vps24/ESCRT-III family)